MKPLMVRHSYVYVEGNDRSTIEIIDLTEDTVDFRIVIPPGTGPTTRARATVEAHLERDGEGEFRII